MDLNECPKNGELICKFFKIKTEEDKKLDDDRHKMTSELNRNAEKFYRQVSTLTFEEWNRPFTI
jgi:hypothetical protein